MTTPKKINPFVKLVLELGPIVLWFVTYGRIKDQHFHLFGQDYAGFIIATALFIPLMIAATGALWWLSGKLSVMQIATLVLIIVFGGLSVWLNDERFFKMKPTIIYLMFGGALLVGLLRGQSYLKLVMEEVMPLKPEGWMILTRRMCALFFALAIVNEVIWRFFSTDIWVDFKTFGLPAAMFLFLLAQNSIFQRYSVERGDENT